jgi:NADPH2:quinone reductase
MEQGACLGIPVITAHRAVHVAGNVAGRTVLVQGGAGAVGACAVQFAHRAGARVIATCRSESAIDVAKRAGANDVLLTDDQLVKHIRELAPEGVDHIVEVDFGTNIKTDVDILALGGSIASYASSTFKPEIPFWLLVFSNLRLFFIGSDDVPAEAKLEATQAVNKALAAGWQGLDIAKRISLNEIAQAHEFVEHPEKPGRVVITI